MVQRILQLSDLHVFADAGAELKGIPTRESLADVVDHILQNEAPFDHVIITGDHTHDELPESYRAVREILSPFLDRLHQVPGNHDDRSVLNSVFGDRTGVSGADSVRFQIAAESWALLGMDTHWPGEVAGVFDDAEAEWLKAALKATEASRIALFFHHPPVSVNSEWMDSIGLNGREAFSAIVEGDDRIRLICCGHVHHEFHGRLGNTDVLTTPSTGIQFDPAGAEPNFATAAPGYRVITIDGPEFETEVHRLSEVKYVPS